MVRIFLTLACVSTLLLIAAFVLGASIEDAKALDHAVDYHFLTALGALVFASLVHAIVLTYFMGTGRWIEETSTAYRLPSEYHQRNRSLKYRTVPWMVLCFGLLLLTGCLGAAADPGSPVQFRGWFGMSGATTHFAAAVLTLTANVLVNVREFRSIDQNGQIVNEVLADVRRIREERGLPV